MLHLLPCLTTFNIVGYINERELNNWCGVLSICNSLHIELHLTCSIVCCTLPCHASLNRTCIILGCASCHVYVMVVYHVVCFFPVLLLSSGNVAIVRIRSTTPVRLLHGLVLLPSGISGKMTATLDLTTIIAMLVASFYRYAALPITCLSSHPKLPWTSNLWHLSYANRCLAMLPLLLSPSYSVASCRWSWSLFHVGTWICWDIIIISYLL